MKIAVEGCAHGELEKIYETLEALEKMENTKIDLLLCCGDFQATRNLADLQTMAVPPKYLDICTFYKYYSGELLAPVLTLFVGGNHEASNYLQELPYGGWVAPNIYYLGYAGVVRINGVRIGGISGIYKGRDYTRGHFEYCPYSEDTKRSVYHVRQLEVFRMKQLSGKLDICMSHDWPSGIHNYGNKSQLLRFKPHFREDIENEQLGSKPCMELLLKLQPTYWFAAHLHCKFAGLVPHEVPDGNDIKITKFLALDKCMPRRRFLQICDIPDVEEPSGNLKFEYDLEWLTILHLTNHLLSVKQGNQYMPGPSAPNERYDFTPTEEEKQQLLEKLAGNLSIPTNFCRTVDPHKIDEMPNNWKSLPQPQPLINPQTTQFCDLLGIDDPVSLALLINGGELKHATDLNERSILESTENEDYLNISASNSPVQGKDLSMELDSKDDENPKMELDGGDCENEEQKEIDENEEGSREAEDHREIYKIEEGPTEAEDHREIDKAEEDPTEVPKEPEEGPCESNVPGETQIKKFKRRNQEIYSEPPLDINADC